MRLQTARPGGNPRSRQCSRLFQVLSEDNLFHKEDNLQHDIIFYQRQRVTGGAELKQKKLSVSFCSVSAHR